MGFLATSAGACRRLLYSCPTAFARIRTRTRQDEILEIATYHGRESSTMFGRPLRITAICAVALACGVLCGCQAFRGKREWRAPTLSVPVTTLKPLSRAGHWDHPDLSKAEEEYALASAARRQNQATCVDHYFLAAASSWSEIQNFVARGCTPPPRLLQVYYSSLLGTINEGTRFHRLDPQQGLLVQIAGQSQVVPVVFHGRLAERSVDQLLAVGSYCTRQLHNAHSESGLGVPLIAVHSRQPHEPFSRKRQLFAATAVLRCDPGVAGPAAILEFYDSTSETSVDVAGAKLALARDVSAPIAHTLINTQRNYVQEFLRPWQTDPDENGLFMLGNYQPGKIPIVFVHGLISDRLTWANLVNELQARPDLLERYQLWGFEYPTGRPFLGSAALLRRQLEELCCYVDPNGVDPALRQIVLVGHSMGGLISRLQVSSSGDRLWQSISRVPLEQLAANDQTRAQLWESFYFEPSCRVTRVVFVGTPHRGSPWAARGIGRLGAALVREPPELKAEHTALIQQNPGAFSEEFVRRLPTSIDLLEPQSGLLTAIARMPMDPRVSVHSIIGTGRWMLGSGDSDGVVPVSSARLGNAESEIAVTARHSKLPEDPAAIEALFDILEHHAVAGFR